MSDFDNPLRQMVNAMSNLGSTHKILLWGDVGIESAKQEEVVQIAASARESLGWRQSANFCNFRCHIRARGGPMENFSFHHNRLADRWRGHFYLLWHIYTHKHTNLQNSRMRFHVQHFPFVYVDPAQWPLSRQPRLGWSVTGNDAQKTLCYFW